MNTKILICQLRNHGDIIRTFPLINSIKFYHPDWFVGFTCFPEMIETCSLCKDIDVIIPQPHILPVTDIQGGTRVLDCSIFKDSVTIAKNYNFDIYLDLHGVFQSAIFGAMSNIKTRLGRSDETSKDGASLFYTSIAQIQTKEINRIERHFKILNHIFPEILPVCKERTLGNKIVIFPGSSKTGILKRWNIVKYIQLANELSKNNIVEFYLGIEDIELKNLIELMSKCKVKTFSSWSDLKTSLCDCKLAVGNDAAYVHLTTWLNIPTIEICGPLSPIINGVWKYVKGETISSPINCYCKHLWSGQCNNNHKCLENISVNMVLKIIKKYL